MEKFIVLMERTKLRQLDAVRFSLFIPVRNIFTNVLITTLQLLVDPTSSAVRRRLFAST